VLAKVVLDEQAVFRRHPQALNATQFTGRRSQKHSKVQGQNWKSDLCELWTTRCSKKVSCLIF